jgi:hypothetical protein
MFKVASADEDLDDVDGDIVADLSNKRRKTDDETERAANRFRYWPTVQSQ